MSCSIFEISDNAAAAFVSAAVLEALGSPTLLCVLGSRMFFNLIEAAEHGVNVGTNWSSHSHSASLFDGPRNGQEQ